MRRFFAAAAAAFTMLAIPRGWAASGTDSNDVSGGLDVKSSAVRTVSVDPGVNRMRLVVTTYDPFDLSDGIGSFYWQIDSTGNGRPDYVAYMFGDPKADGGPLFCLLKARDGSLKQYVSAKQGSSSFLCGFPRRYVDTTKPIRWRTAGRQEGVIDRAPDTGWLELIRLDRLAFRRIAGRGRP
jgi:hypothetical protein